MIANFIDVSPAMRYMRSLAAEEVRKHIGWKRGECTWCGAPCPKGRWGWCSKECQSAFFTRCNQADAKRAVIRRDAIEPAKHLGDCIVACAACGAHMRAGKTEMDHIIPVSEGGGLCGLENYRLLCLVCHKQESSEGTRRRTRQRRARRATA